MKDGASKRSRLRALSDEEIELWTRIAASVTPRAGAMLPTRVTPPPVAPAPDARPAPPQIIEAAKTAPPRTGVAPFAPLDRTLKRRLARGRMTADDAIDLHGLRQEQAYSALRHFLSRAQTGGARVVLVVTGKGSHGGAVFSPLDGPGVLRRAVPLWLALPDFRPMVVGFEQAGRSHGGAGALYVRLRSLSARLRNTGSR